MKKIAIIGGGLSGLSAGIFGLKAGYETVIYEKNAGIGGCCYAWKRGDYTIDNCFHWLMGTKPGTKQNDFWQEIGALSDDTPIHHRQAFYTSELDGKRLTLWRDLERTKRELLEHSPEDEEEINRFIDCVFTCQTVLDSAQGTFDLKAVLSDINGEVSKAALVKTLYRYMKHNLREWSEKFKDPLIRKLILDFQANEYEAFWLAMSYAMFTSGGADIPIGGSDEFSKRVEEHYISLGGKIFHGMEADHIEFASQDKILAQDVASGIRFTDGSFAEADYIVCTCPITHTFTQLLDKKYAPAAYERLEDREKNPIYSAFHVAFSVDSEMEEVDDLLYFPCEPVNVGCQVYDRIQLKNYRSFGPQIAPPGQTVVQCSFVQYPEDIEMWISLRKTIDRYRELKLKTSHDILERIETRFPEYKGKIHFLDSWTPATYERYLNTSIGMYMRYITTPLSADAIVPQDLPNVKNVFIAGHVLTYPGGTPMAAYSGKHVISKIENAEKTLLGKIPIIHKG